MSCNVSVFPPAYREKSDKVDRLEIHWPAKSSKAQQYRKPRALAYRLLVNKSKTQFLGKHKPENIRRDETFILADASRSKFGIELPQLAGLV